MNKTEIEEAIKNGESVWCVNSALKEIIELKLNKNYILYSNSLQNKINCLHYFLNELYKTKTEAEHYLNHANVKRVEQLPFVTWEEFDNGDRFIRFTGKNKENCKLEGYQSDDKQTGFIDIVVDGTGLENYFYYNEENFYKAYDECVKLFKGEEI